MDWSFGWHELWFIAGALALLAALLLLLHTRRVLAIQARARVLDQQLAQRNEALRRANARLEQEIVQRQRAEQALASRAEAALQVSEARFRAMFDNAPVGMALMTPERRVLQANPSAARITGYTCDELKAPNNNGWQ